MKKILFSLTFYCLALVAFSQDKVVVPTPEAASLIKMSQNELSYQTGSAVVGVPIYTLSEGGLTVPIGLSYSGSSGIKVDEAATWVGLGWDLSAGGQITRVVRDKPDESYTMNFIMSEKGGITGFKVGVTAAGASRGVEWNNERIMYRGGWALAGNVSMPSNILNADFNQSDPILFDTQFALMLANDDAC